jgi:hypothetical protein
MTDNTQQSTVNAKILALVVELFTTHSDVPLEQVLTSNTVHTLAYDDNNQLSLSFNRASEQWSIMLLLDGEFFVFGGYKEYRLLVSNDYESFTDLETGLPVTNDTAVRIVNTLMSLTK